MIHTSIEAWRRIYVREVLQVLGMRGVGRINVQITDSLGEPSAQTLFEVAKR